MIAAVQPRTARVTLALRTVGLASAGLVLLIYAASALQLLRYRWDWSPDEGMAIDAAIRSREGLSAIYNRSLPPWPWGYGPLLPSVLALVGERTGFSVGELRPVAVVWTLALAVSAFLLTRRRAGTELALCTTAIVLVPFSHSCFLLLLRVDGLMCTLWLLAALQLLPLRLERGGDRLSSARIAAGSLLLVAAAAAKATALVHASPLLLGWWLVDRRSFARLMLATATGLLATIGLLQLATGGDFLYVSSLLASHPRWAVQVPMILGVYARACALPLLLAATVAAIAAYRRVALHRDPAVLLVAGGALAIPLLAKGGATWHYLLPLSAALAVFLGRSCGALAEGPASRAAVIALLGSTALATALSQPFPLPDARATASAETFYGLVHESLARAPGPLLAVRPDYASVLAGQPLEVDGGGSFYFLARAHVAGTEKVLARIEQRSYSVVVGGPWFLPEDGPWMGALAKGYRPLALCALRYYFGWVPFTVYVRRRGPGEQPSPAPVFPPDSGCRAYAE